MIYEIPLSFFASPQSIHWSIRFISYLRSLYVFLITENPLLWVWALQGRRNPRADMEGPFYKIGAPDRQLVHGKAVLASISDLIAFPAYLMTLTVKTPKGDPIPYATVDWWQADSASVYSNTTYRLRGTFKTDANGNVEILTVPPGKYGPGGHERAGHFHTIISGGQDTAWEPLTTQIYVCPGNNTKEMESDFLNYVRAQRSENMVTTYRTPSPNPAGDNGVFKLDFPDLSPTDVDMHKKISWWNDRLAEHDLASRITACGHTEIALNARPQWL